MVALTHRHGHKCDLIASLGLPHDTPLIEWHDWKPTVVDDLPIAATGVDGWRYLPNLDLADTINRADPEFDDRAWSTGPTPFGYEETNPASSVEGGAPGLMTRWLTQSAIWLRRVIRTAPGAAVTLSGQVDDFVDVYWNGVLVYSKTTGSAGPWGPVVIPAAQVRVTNLLAIRAADDVPHHAIEASLITVGVAKVAAGPLLAENRWTLNPDRTAALIDYDAAAGRATPTQNTDALTATVHLARYLVDTIPETGDRFRLTLSADVAAALGIPDAERPRFTGEVTDSDVDARGDLSVVSVSALGRRARLNRQPVVVRRPQELDGERVRRILAAAQIALPLDVGTIEPGTVSLLPSEVDAPAAPAIGLVDQVTADSLGQLVEHRSGRLDYQDADHRRGRPSVVTLTGDQHLIRPFTWRQSIASLVNDATATFGTARQQVRVVDPGSADPNTGVGPYGAQLDTQLAGVLDAYALLTNLVGRYSRPSWWLPSVLVDLDRTAADQRAAILQLNHGDKITAAGLPPDGAFTDGDVFVEGTHETHTAAAWRVELTVADPRLAGAGLRWVDLPRFLRWVDVDPTLTWLDLATLTDPYALGDPVLDGGDADDVTLGLIVNGGDASTTSWDYVLSGALP